jgi:hypothetical protein
VVFAILIALFLILLGSPAHAQGETLTPAQRHAAEVAKGEAPPAWVGTAGYVMALCTIQGRMNDPRFPDTLPGVMTAYYAPPVALTPDEAKIAADVFNGWMECGPKPILYLLSYQDVARLGLPAGDWTSPPFVLPSGTEMGLHAYTTSPWAAQ